ncbi:MAG: hypothetical protein LBG43_03875 [Treponema sp.]|nr:hypothetical protein [Treponema sp.]
MKFWDNPSKHGWIISDNVAPIFERIALPVMKRYTPEQARRHYDHGLVAQIAQSIIIQAFL